ncbi:MAG TPA: hypothetical protein VFU02_07010 [Polyangiaceae bacterium]|nr:hypothetical protein [Polyangiaceae bacterium]
MVTSLATMGRTCAALTAFCVTAPPAFAQVTFVAPPECGSREEFLTEVRALQRAGAESTRVTSVAIQERAAGVFELRLDGPEGGRVLTDPDCRTLFRSAVVIAAAAGSDSTSEGAAPAAPIPASVTQANPPAPPPAATSVEPAPVAPSPPARQQPVPAAGAALAPVPAPSVVEPVPRVPDSLPASEAGGYYLRLAAGGGATTGLSPELALLLELGVAYGSETWGGSVVMKYLPPSSATTEGDLGLELETIGGRSGLFYAPLSFLRVEAGLAVYRLTARGTGITHPSTDSVWMAAPELEVMAVVRLSTSWALELGPQGRVGLTQPTFRVQPETEVFQVPRFGAALVFRVQWGWR